MLLAPLLWMRSNSWVPPFPESSARARMADLMACQVSLEQLDQMGERVLTEIEDFDA